MPGRALSLSDQQLGELYALVAGNDPRQLQFEFALWTREMVQALIKRRFGVSLSVTTVGRILKGLGMSAQKPLWRAYQADPQAVEHWKRTEYPKIAKLAKKRKATIYFADEASVRSDYHRGTTWAPVGQTPVIATTGARFSVNMTFSGHRRRRAAFFDHRCHPDRAEVHRLLQATAPRRRRAGVFDP